MKNLIEIQSELNVPRRRYNRDEGYYYRNAEDILEAVKPLLLEKECLLYLSDTLVHEGDRYYIMATATFVSPSGFQQSVAAYAREPEMLEDMVEGQITGATSSFARKYALCGLFNIDDNRDFDSMEFEKPVQTEQPKAPETKEQPKASGAKDTDKVSGEQAEHIREIMKATKRSQGSLLAFFNVSRSGAGLEDAKCIEDLTYAEYKRLLTITGK